MTVKIDRRAMLAGGLAVTTITPAAAQNKTLFDTYLIIDWSAANESKKGPDSIWAAAALRKGMQVSQKIPVNIATRTEAIMATLQTINNQLAENRRVFVGFDFPFGYPAGGAKKITGEARWDALWRFLKENVEDDKENNSNRFTLADQINAESFAEPVYWGRPHQQEYAHIPAKKEPSAWRDANEFRLVEKAQPPAKSVWQLAYNGAVGSQAMLGIAWLEALRGQFGDECAIWPFETQWNKNLDAKIVIAEIYPSMFKTTIRENEIKDEAQVRTTAMKISSADMHGRLRQWLSRPAALTDAQSQQILREEGWIVGAGHTLE